MSSTLKLEISFKWWFKFYKFGVTWFSIITKCEPDKKQLEYWIMKAMIIKVKTNG